MLFRLALLQVIFLLLVQLSLSDDDSNGGNQNQNNSDQPPADQNDQNNGNGNDSNAKYDCQFDGIGGFIKCPFQKIRYGGHIVKEAFLKLCPVCDQPMRTDFNPTGNFENLMGNNDADRNLKDSGFDPKGNFDKLNENGGDQNNGQ